jgi:hypothetical protein
VTPASLDTHAAVQSADAAAVGSDFHGVEVSARISAGGSSAAVATGAHLHSLGLPSVGWLTAASLSSWLAASDYVSPAQASGPASASNHPPTEAPAAGLVGSTSGAGIDLSDASVSPARNGMTDEPQESMPPAGASPAGDPSKTEEAPAGPATPGAPDATGPSGDIRADGGDLQTIAAPAESGGDVSGLEGSVGQLFGWVTDLSSLSGVNELGLYLALVALGASAAAAEVRRRKHRAESKNYTEATQQPRLAILNVPA